MIESGVSSQRSAKRALRSTNLRFFFHHIMRSNLKPPTEVGWGSHKSLKIEILGDNFVKHPQLK